MSAADAGRAVTLLVLLCVCVPLDASACVSACHSCCPARGQQRLSTHVRATRLQLHWRSPQQPLGRARPPEMRLARSLVASSSWGQRLPVEHVPPTRLADARHRVAGGTRPRRGPALRLGYPVPGVSAEVVSLDPNTAREVLYRAVRGSHVAPGCTAAAAAATGDDSSEEALDYEITICLGT